MSLRWMRDNLYAAEAEADRQRGGDGYGPVTDAAARVPPGCEGLLFLPYMAGPGTVPVDGDVRGVYWGLELHHGRAHMARAVMESMGYLLRYLAERMVLAGLPCREIRLLGGGAKSPLWRQIKADVTGRPVASATCPEAASLGVAMECAVALRVHGTLDRAFGAMGALSQISHPSDPGRAAYEIAYMAFEALHRRIGRSYT
jgi:xylulokinase